MTTYANRYATENTNAMRERMKTPTTFQPEGCFGAAGSWAAMGSAIADCSAVLALAAIDSALADSSAVLVDLACRASSPGAPQPGQTGAISDIVWSHAEHW